MRMSWSKGYILKHPVKAVPAQFLVNVVTRQQQRAELRKMGMEWVSIRYGGELRAKRRELGLARARNAWTMLQMQNKIGNEKGRQQ